MNSSEKKLLAHFRELTEIQRETLLAFAEFLRERDEVRAASALPEPEPIPAVADESVVGALKRLSASYHMLDKGKMLNETSALVGEHVMQGRDRDEVIQDLEQVFERHYRALAERDK